MTAIEIARECGAEVWFKGSHMLFTESQLSTFVQRIKDEASAWKPMAEAPRDAHLLASVGGIVRMIRWGKTSHMPWCGWCLADQGVEEFDLCEPDGWLPLPAAIRSGKVGGESTGVRT